MRRRVWLIAALSAVLHFSMPATADAWIWRLIDELSGPGPFRGAELEWRVVCFAEPEDPDRLDALGVTPDVITKARTDRKLDKKAIIVGVLGPGCFFNPVEIDERRRASINLGFGMFDAKENNLEYGNRDINRDVKLTTLTPSAWWRPTRSVEVGIGVGIWFFSGGAFDSFQRVVLQPGHLDLKPLAAINQLKPGSDNGPWWDELVSVRAGWYVVPNGFSDRDFGAVPGTFRVPRESLFSFAIFADLDPLFMELKRRHAGGGANQKSRP